MPALMFCHVFWAPVHQINPALGQLEMVIRGSQLFYMLDEIPLESQSPVEGVADDDGSPQRGAQRRLNGHASRSAVSVLCPMVSLLSARCCAGP